MSFGATSGLSSSFGTLDVNSMVTQLMQVERNPQRLMQNRALQMKNKATAIKAVATDVKALRTAAESLNVATKWQPLKTSSSSAAVTVSGTTGAVTGSLTFSVDQKATAQKFYSTSTHPSTSAIVATPGHFLVAAGMGSMGVGTVSSGADLALGNHTVAVTQSSAAAVKTADNPLAGVEITGANNTLELKFNGATYNLNLATGTYAGPQELLDAVQLAMTGAGLDGVATASLDGAGALTFTTVREGSAATVQVVDNGSSTALADLGLSVDATEIGGTDAIVTVGGHATNVTSVEAGGSVVLASVDGADAITMAFTGGLRTGTSNVRNVDLGDGSLGAVATALNTSTTVAAAAVKVGDDQYRFQIESRMTGESGRLNIDWDAFTGGPAAFASLSAGSDAQVSVKDSGGAVAYTIDSSSNTFTDVLPGVSFTLGADATGEVTVSASRDVTGLADKVNALVTAFNTMVYGIKNKTTWNAETKVGGPLNGNLTVQRAQTELRTAFLDTVDGADLAIASKVGITLGKDGILEFDKAAFTAAYQDDPAAVERLFFAPIGDEDKGIAQRLVTAADTATSFASGYLTTSGNQFDSTVATIDKQIDAFEERLAIREVALRRQWNAVNTLLEQLNGQSNSVFQALSQLPTTSAGSGSD